MSELRAIANCRDWLRAGAVACLVMVEDSRGSVPRARGAWLAVLAGGQVVGTIGGGRLEFEAIQVAVDWLASNAPATPDCSWHDYPLGPALGQCCGGRVRLSYSVLTPERLQQLEQAALYGLRPVALFGGGHVGTAVVRLLVDLPFQVHWVDSRENAFDRTPAAVNLRCDVSEPVQQAVADLAPGAAVLIMSFSHAEDYDLVQACLLRRRQQRDLPFIGLIGSATKWATFSRRLRQRGFAEDELAAVTCPIGVPGIQGKEPEVIALAVVAQLLQQ